VHLKENVGLDFGMWRHALERVDLGAWDELVLANSSVFGPLTPLARAFERMAPSDCDFWGMTNNHELAPHIQSYFLVFRRAALASTAFGRFWQGVLPYESKWQITLSYEVGLTTYLVENGLRPALVAPVEELPVPFWRRDVVGNPTCRFPVLLLEEGVPFVKVELLRENPLGVPLWPIYRWMQRRGYDLGLVEFDRPFKRKWKARWLLHDPSWWHRRARSSAANN
jgi:lipopolysaccharide biosynthesis protein